MNYNNTILYGDALEMLTDLPRQTVQMCVTSPPYWGLRDYNVEGQIGLEQTPEEYISRLRDIFSQVKRILKDDGTLWLNLGDSYYGSGGPGSFVDNIQTDNFKNGTHKNPARDYKGLKPKDLCMIPARVAMALQADGWYLRSEIIWHKPNCMPESVKDRPTNAHEKIYLLSKSRTYYYDWQAIAEPLADSTLRDSRTLEEAYTEKRPQRDYPGRAQNGSGMLKPYGTKRNKRTVWQVPLRPYKGAHFAVYPPDLIAPCIKAGSKKGDLVLDPFFGSGTTGEVAKALGRYYLGIELNKEYADLQHHRLNQQSFYF